MIGRMEEEERRETRTLEEYIERMEESEKKRLFDYLKERRLLENLEIQENNRLGKLEVVE